MLNVKFNFGQGSKKLINVTVVNITAECMLFNKTVSDSGEISYQPSIYMEKVMEIWEESDRPSYLDLSDLKKNRWGEEDDTLEEVF